MIFMGIDEILEHKKILDKRNNYILEYEKILDKKSDEILEHEKILDKRNNYMQFQLIPELIKLGIEQNIPFYVTGEYEGRKLEVANIFKDYMGDNMEYYKESVKFVDPILYNDKQSMIRVVVKEIKKVIRQIKGKIRTIDSQEIFKKAFGYYSPYYDVIEDQRGNLREKQKCNPHDSKIYSEGILN